MFVGCWLVGADCRGNSKPFCFLILRLDDDEYISMETDQLNDILNAILGHHAFAHRTENFARLSRSLALSALNGTFALPINRMSTCVRASRSDLVNYLFFSILLIDYCFFFHLTACMRTASRSDLFFFLHLIII